MVKEVSHTWEPLVSGIDELETPLFRDLFLAPIAEADGRRAEILVADGGLEGVHRDAIVQLGQIHHRGGRGRCRVRLYAMLNNYKGP